MNLSGNKHTYRTNRILLLIFFSAVSFFFYYMFTYYTYAGRFLETCYSFFHIQKIFNLSPLDLNFFTKIARIFFALYLGFYYVLFFGRVLEYFFSSLVIYPENKSVYYIHSNGFFRNMKYLHSESKNLEYCDNLLLRIFRTGHIRIHTADSEVWSIGYIYKAGQAFKEILSWV
ncbi:MAG TPA: hypothetical protein PLJ29_12955 [Leptospiraceae bacterium]|nr:hypothetical protein [Leptospiraceae bacterium]HMY67575.1 hypothetical protein [Leptospiraceae bacterium]HNF27530.1 hypothetical protein [Leptospiraceae bacterium]HNH10919.1 hypothetical protein [Leptospiraceae bacterium]HNI27266.1 hypothetical protein [Leptospiraceae bacterium]